MKWEIYETHLLSFCSETPNISGCDGKLHVFEKALFPTIKYKSVLDLLSVLQDFSLPKVPSRLLIRIPTHPILFSPQEVIQLFQPRNPHSMGALALHPRTIR
jgi:hypothetical protein